MWWKERTDSHKLFSDLPMHTIARTYTLIHPHNLNIVKGGQLLGSGIVLAEDLGSVYSSCM